MPPVLLKPGQIIRVRSCQCLVGDVTPPILPTGEIRVRLACLEDDAQGDTLEIFREREIELTECAKRKLEQRGGKEATEMKSLLEEQRDRILKQVKQYETQQLSLFNADKIRQLTQITAIEKNEWLN